MTDRWQPCPRCSSVRVKKQFGANEVGGLILLGVVLILLTYLYSAFLVAGLILILLGVLAGATSRRQLECEDCHNKWKAAT